MTDRPLSPDLLRLIRDYGDRSFTEGYELAEDTSTGEKRRLAAQAARRAGKDV